jgi:hypothetical protein
MIVKSWFRKLAFRVLKFNNCDPDFGWAEGIPMKHTISRFVGLVLFVALLVGAPLLSAREHDKYKDPDKNKACDGDRDKDDRHCGAVSMPDSHGGPLLVLSAGALGAAMLIQRRRKIAS